MIIAMDINLLINYKSQKHCSYGHGKNGADKKVISKKCAPFTNCISRINSSQVDHDYDVDAVMLVYNLMEYNDNYSKTS